MGKRVSERTNEETGREFIVQRHKKKQMGGEERMGKNKECQSKFIARLYLGLPIYALTRTWHA